MLIRAFEASGPGVVGQGESSFTETGTETGPLFRGKSAYFWKKAFFNGLEDYRDGEEFDFLVLFDRRYFPILDEEQRAQLVDFLSRRRGGNHMFSVDGMPFVIFSYAAFEGIHGDVVDGDLPEEIRQGIEMIDGELSGVVCRLPLLQDYLRDVETEVVDHQIAKYMADGVLIEDLGHFFVDGLPPIGSGTRLASGVVIRGETRIGENVVIYPHCYIENANIGNHCTLLPGSIVIDSGLEENVQIGPYTHLRGGALVKRNAKMGNFVEMKKSVLGEGSKSMHLTYLGDAQVGPGVNVGAGTITCNYDGVAKHPTVIGEGAFIGSGTELVAPVTVGANSYVGAGSTITEDVPADSLAVARNKQRNIPGWAKRKRNKKNNPS